ncbi:unnamed protein product, partial [Symbiodinium sp. CCMP2456]
FKTPQFWATAVASGIFRFCAAPSFRLEVHHINWVILLVNMLCLAIGFGVPRQLFPVLAVGRVSIGVFSPEPVQVLGLNAVLSPCYFMLAWRQERTYDATSLASCIIAELFVLLQLALILLKLQGNLHELAATVRTESRLCDVEASGLAARKLVTVTCDAFVRLTSSLTILEPHQRLVDMLGAKKEALEGQSFMNYVSSSDRARLRDQIDTICQSDAPATSLSLRLMDAVGTALDTRIYHVCMRNPMTDVMEHLIGITEVTQEQQSSRVASEYSGSRHDLASADMRSFSLWGCSVRAPSLCSRQQGLPLGSCQQLRNLVRPAGIDDNAADDQKLGKLTGQDGPSHPCNKQDCGSTTDPDYYVYTWEAKHNGDNKADSNMLGETVDSLPDIGVVHGPKPPSLQPSQPTTDGDLAPNMPRKAEQKVSSIEKQIQDKKKQWQTYLEDMKTAWLKESQRHAKALETLQDELVKATRAQDAARTELRDVHQAAIAGTVRDKPVPELEQTWDTMMAQWTQEGEASTPEAVLRRAVQGEPRRAEAQPPIGGHALPPPGLTGYPFGMPPPMFMMPPYMPYPPPTVPGESSRPPPDVHMVPAKESLLPAGIPPGNATYNDIYPRESAHIDGNDRDPPGGRGPPPPVAVRHEIDNKVQHTRPVDTIDVAFPVWIAAPGYQPKVMQLQLGMPCDIEDATDVVERATNDNQSPFSSRAIPVRPQPFPTCAAYVLAPDWTTYAALTLVCLDLRDMSDTGEGLYGTKPAQVFVGTDQVWRHPARFPKQTGAKASLLLLHETGVDRSTVDFYAPTDPILEHFQYKGVQFAVLGQPQIPLNELQNYGPITALEGRTYVSELIALLADVLPGHQCLQVAQTLPCHIDAAKPGHFKHACGPHTVLARLQRILSEPSSSNRSGQELLSNLRRITVEIDGMWPYQRHLRALPMGPAPEEVDEDSTPEGPRWVSCLILAPEYVPEQVTVSLQFPAVLADLLTLIQQVRDPDKARRFPYLHHVLPQRLTGVGVFVATPHWRRDARILCMDLTRLDGRLFATQAPAYADRSVLLELADLTDTPHIQVLAGIDSVSLQGDAMIHAALGTSITFLPADQTPDAEWNLPTALLRSEEWRTEPNWSPPHEDAVYCLVYNQSHRRIHVDLHNPPRYRQQLAQAIDAQEHEVVVTPSAPRISDSEIDGIACLTAIAIAKRQVPDPDRSHLIILDLRALFEGWATWPVWDHQLQIPELLQSLRISAPFGYDITIEGIDNHETEVGTVPGQVFVIGCIPGPIPLPATHVPRATTWSENDQGEDVVYLAAPEVTEALEAIQRAMPALLYGQPMREGSAYAVRPEPLQLLVAVPDYLPELHEIDVELPVAMDTSLGQFSTRRWEQDRRRFPGLIPVAPQPDARFATIIALPAWPATQRIILVDARRLDERLFAVCVPDRLELGSILTLADVDPSQQVSVHVGDSPWPLEEGRAVQVTDGDLITIAPSPFAMPRRDVLRDMLRSQEGWSAEDAFAGRYDDRIWVVTDTSPILYDVDRSRLQHFRSDVAAAIGTTSSALRLQPVRPPVRDFADLGRLTRSVLLALVDVRTGEPSASEDVPFILDMRPVHHILAGDTLIVEFLSQQDANADDGATHDGAPPQLSEAAVASNAAALFDPATSTSPAGQGGATSTTDRDNEVSQPPSQHRRLSNTPKVQRLARRVHAYQTITGRVAKWSKRQREHAHCTGNVCYTSVLLVLVCSVCMLGNRALPILALFAQWRYERLRRSAEADDLYEYSSCLGPTLLEQSVADLGYQIFRQQADALEALRARHYRPQGTPMSTYTVEEHVILPLAELVPVSEYQTQVLRLTALLPFLAEAGEALDWLDNSLGYLTQDPQVPLEHRTRFANVRTWDEAGHPAPELLRVYTDGSAAQLADNPTACAWAFGVWAVLQGELLLVGYASGSAVGSTSPYHLGEVDDTPQTSEQLAIAWALCWVVEFGPRYRCPIQVDYDCLVAGRGAFGVWKVPTSSSTKTPSDLSAYLVHLRQLATTRVEMTHDHVPGHAGHLANEFSDQLAKKARRLPEPEHDRMLPTWPAQLRDHPLRAWCWMLADSTGDLPPLYTLESEAARLQADDARPTKAPFPGAVKSIPRTECVYDFAVLTYNVLTLRPAAGPQQQEQVGLRVIGRKALLKQQISELHPLLIGLQETRLPQDSMQADSDYWIYQSGATPTGQLGCALWIAQHVPYAHKQGRPLYIRSSEVYVCGVSPRHLCACIQAEALKLYVIVAHAPSASSVPLAEVKAFWAARAKDLARRPPGHDFLILADANARVGSMTSIHVGDVDPEEENPAGETLHDFLQDIGACLPTTFTEVHTGPSATWASPGGGEFRIDYPIVPLSWAHFSLSSKVLPDFELLQLRDDHRPVVLQCRCATKAPPACYAPHQPSAARPSKPTTVAATRAVQAALAGVPAFGWQLDVDEHYERLSTSWRQTGQDLDHVDRPAKAASTQTYLSPHTRHLVEMRQSLRCYLRLEAKERKRRLLQFGFAVFRTHAQGRYFTAAQFHVLRRWFAELDYSEAEALHRLHVYGYYIRCQVEIERRNYLASLADQVRLQDVRHPRPLYQAVRKAYPAARSARTSAFKPLPAVCDEQGELVVTGADRIERWRSHFGRQEAGHPATDEQYIQHMQECSRLSKQTVFDLDAVPTLAELETIAQALPPRKAAGLDKVAGELLQIHTPTMMRQFYPVCLKASLALREPVHFRGGELICLAKKAGAVLQCSSFRSILISSVPGKILHRALRTRLVALLDQHRPPMQAGAVPGEGIEHIALAAQCFQHLHHHHRRPWALVFYDVQAAFYSVVRQLVVPGDTSDRKLLLLLHELGLPSAAIDELRNKLEGLAMLPAMQASPHLTALVQDLYRGTWFKLTHSAITTITRRGTRPGDPAADAVFGLVMSALLRSIEEVLATNHLLPEKLTPTDPPTWAELPIPQSWGCPAWADDFVQPVDGRDTQDLLERTQASVAIVAGRVIALGMRLTFAVDKTAVVLPNWVPEEAHILCVDRHGQRFIPIVSGVTQEYHELPVVSAYKHLGGILVADGSPVPDLRYGYSKAMSVVRPLRRRLFADRNTPIATRRTLLRTLAISKFAYSAATLFLRAGIHQRLWAQQYISLWRCLHANASHQNHVHAYQVLHLAQAPSPPLALARARAAFLARLTGDGPTALGAWLFAHWQRAPKTSWLAQLETDYQAVITFLPEVKAFIPAKDCVQGLLETFVDNPRWWFKQVIKATKVFLHDLRKWHAAGACTPHTAALAAPSNFACPLCDATFVLRKHLGVHLARTHQVISPSRHFAPVEHCLACMRHYGCVQRVQQHLKQSAKCLLRAAHVIPPLSLSDVRQAESLAKSQAARIKKGAWREYVPPCAAALAYGPRIPTGPERLTGLPDDDEDLPLSGLRPPYTPPASVVAWITDYIGESSKEGPRAATVSFWGSRPGFTA